MCIRDRSKELAKHDDVDGLWYFGTPQGSKDIELLSADNLKRTWVNDGKYRDWMDKSQMPTWDLVSLQLVQLIPDNTTGEGCQSNGP